MTILGMRRATITAFEQPLEIVPAPVPAPTGREVLVRVRHCGVCHTDLHLRHGFYDLGGAKRWSFAERGLVPPITPGHEIFGEIVAAGDAVPDAIGRTGVVFPWIGCGACPRCLAEEEQDCLKSRFLGFRQPGGFGGYVTLPDPRYLLDVSGIAPALAASLACAGLTAYSALKKLRPDAESPLVIIGAGGLGLAAVGLAKRLGFVRLLVVEPHEQRRAAALAAGADEALAPDAVAQRRPALLGSVASVVDFVGRPETFDIGTGLLRRNGRYVLVGLFGGEVTLPLPVIALKAISLIGSAVGSYAEMVELIHCVRSSPPADTPIRHLPLDGANDALDALERGAVVGRLVLDP